MERTITLKSPSRLSDGLIKEAAFLAAFITLLLAAAVKFLENFWNKVSGSDLSLGEIVSIMMIGVFVSFVLAIIGG